MTLDLPETAFRASTSLGSPPGLASARQFVLGNGNLWLLPASSHDPKAPRSTLISRLDACTTSNGPWLHWAFR